MRIFTKKAFGFVNPDPTKEVNGAREVVRTTPLGFHDVPEWVVEDDMFKWGKEDGDIEVIVTEVKVSAKEAAKTKAAEEAKKQAEAKEKEELEAAEKEEAAKKLKETEESKTKETEVAKGAGWVNPDAKEEKK